MSNVVPFLRNPPMDPTPHAEFYAARQAMAKAFLAWLATNPPADNILAEATGTVGLIQQLVQIYCEQAGG